MAEGGNDVPRGLPPVLARLLVESDRLDGDLDRDRDGREDILKLFAEDLLRCFQLGIFSLN